LLTEHRGARPTFAELELGRVDVGIAPSMRRAAASKPRTKS
jgi:hypothetical protein